MTRSPSGVLVVAKPAGVTSHDVVEQIRRLPIARGGKVGHAGTLDPFATGALLVLIGQATRFQRFFMALPKTYEATAQLGARSDTGDPTGRLTESGERADAPAVRAAAARLVGEIDQRVPLTSAVKVGGERLYLKARRGEEFETPVRRVRVMRLDVSGLDEQAQTAQIVVECSSGTYVRQLVADLGDLCGAGAYCAALARTAIGPFSLADADEGRLVPLVEALSFLPERALDPDEVPLVRTGRAVENGSEHGAKAAPSSVRLTAGGELVAVAERRDGKLKPVTVIPDPSPRP
jgi:tRNA pseudouridine55 synthase